MTAQGRDRGRPGLSLSTVLSPVFTGRYLDLAQRLLTARAAPLALPHWNLFRHEDGNRSGPELVRIGGHVARQHDGVTCGAAAIMLLNAAIDPHLAAWLEHGRLPAATPPEIATLDAAGLAAPTVAARMVLAQGATHRILTRAGPGRLPWPRALGTPPWGAARGARVPGVRYTHRAVDDHNPAVLRATTDMLVAATSAGVPVPLYAGGNRARGWRTAVPRHVLLALPTAGDRLRIFDPGTGYVHRVRPEELAARRTPHPALGNWTHLAWTLIPLVDSHR
ncbi:hypothetical protein [Pseudactinotalea sp. Z1732]|uniref:hypothetical protein n=1 Tax=Micrococcales TaxID=85006 RepID=UPI003C7BF481